MKTILFVDHDPGYSGSTVSLLYLVKYFALQNFKVYVLTAKDQNLQNIFSDNAVCIDSRLFSINPFFLFISFTNNFPVLSYKGIISNLSIIVKILIGIYKAFKIISKLKPDLIYVNEYTSLQASIVSRILRIPCVTHIRSRLIEGKTGLRRHLLGKTIVMTNDLCFAITKIEGNQLPQHKNNVIVVHEFLEESNFTVVSNKNTVFNKFEIPANRYLVVMLGGIGEIKGTDMFLKAAEMAVKQNQNLFFVIAGPQFINCSDYVKKCYEILNLPSLRDNIKYIGEITNPTELISCSNLLVSSNTQTHFSRPVIEAWAQKKPVIVTDTAHSIELVDNYVNGIIVNTGSYEEMANAIIKLSRDEMISNKLAEAGYMKASTDFNHERTIGYIYRKCLDIIN